MEALFIPTLAFIRFHLHNNTIFLSTGSHIELMNSSWGMKLNVQSALLFCRSLTRSTEHVKHPVKYINCKSTILAIARLQIQIFGTIEYVRQEHLFSLKVSMNEEGKSRKKGNGSKSIDES